VLEALQFDSPNRNSLVGLSEDAWRRALRFCERAQLTLAIAVECRDHLPDAVRCRMDRHLVNNAERWERTQAAYRELASAFDSEGLDHAVLKGFSHCPLFVRDPRHRGQGDLDLLLVRDQLLRARDIVAQLGYEPITPVDEQPIDHLPTMIRKTGWMWRGDPYDPEMPLSLELHFQLWDERTERVAPRGLDCFWQRRQGRDLEGLQFTAFHPADTIAYSALHSLRHLLRGDTRIFHIYELAQLLHRHADDAGFWDVWRELHDPSLRMLEAICFSLAAAWFACRLPEAARQEIAALPPDVKRWLETYSWSGIESLFHPNKDELWLHWSLIESGWDRMAMLRRRLVPERLPNGFGVTHMPDSQVTRRMRVRSGFDYLKYLASRCSHHARALPSTAWSAIRWFGGC
jgi:putative nucleotidyltransferase-like protein